MANKALIVVGIFFVGLSALGFLYPVNDVGNSLIQVDELCASGFGQLTQFLSGRTQEACQQIQFIPFAVYGIGITGVIMIIIGAIIGREKTGFSFETNVKQEEKEDDPLDILKKRYAKGDITKDEFEHLKRELQYLALGREKKEYSIEELNKINEQRWKKNNPVEREFQKEIREEIQELKKSNANDDEIEEVMLGHGLEAKNTDEYGEDYWICSNCKKEEKFNSREDYISHHFQFHS